MTTRTRWIAAWVVAGAAVVGAASLASARGDERPAAAPQPASDADLPDACQRRAQRPVRIDTAKLIIEYNATDDDIGVHGAFDDHGWSALCVFDPGGRPVAVVDPRNQLNDLTMAGVFFESREPPAAEFSFEDLAAAFPEGRYTVRAKSYDGTTLVGAATFTHDVPAPPEITAPALADEADQPGAPVPPDGMVVEWNPVTEGVDGDPVTITGYQVIVTKEDHDDPHGFSRPIYDVHVGPDQTSLSVPAEFLEPGSVYELEVLALETSGNQTISVGFFATA